MEAAVLIVATLDTKEAETAFLRNMIEAQGLKTLIIDTGLRGYFVLGTNGV